MNRPTPHGWSVDLWDYGHYQRRGKAKEGEEAFAAGRKAERAVLAEGDRIQLAIIRTNVRGVM